MSASRRRLRSWLRGLRRRLQARVGRDEVRRAVGVHGVRNTEGVVDQRVARGVEPATGREPLLKAAVVVGAADATHRSGALLSGHARTASSSGAGVVRAAAAAAVASPQRTAVNMAAGIAEIDPVRRAAYYAIIDR